MHGSTSVRYLSRGAKGGLEGRRRDGGSRVSLLYLICCVLMYGPSLPDFGVPGDLVGSVSLVHSYIHVLRVDDDCIQD